MNITTKEAAADCIFSNGSCLVDLDRGFKLAIHQELPDAPPSPFYMNLRPLGVKEGKMSANDIRIVARSMFDLGKENDLFVADRVVGSIPAAGDPYLDAIMVEEGRSAKRFYLNKTIVGGKRKFQLHGNYDMSSLAWQKVSLVDDLVASSLTKKLAMKPINDAGGRVTDLLLFLDRSGNAREELGQLGVAVHAVWELDSLLEWALGKGHLKRHEFEAIVQYPLELEKYKKAVGFV